MLTQLNKLAAIAASFMVTRQRANKEDYVSCKSGAPDWVNELCHAAHGDMLPDNSRYTMIADALSALANCDNADDIQIEPPPYYSDLAAWLSTYTGHRLEYCDEYQSEMSKVDCTSALLSGGYYMEQQEVLGSVRQSLEAQVELQEEAQDDDE